MVNVNNTDNLDFLFKSFERNLYFKSKLLTVEGFEREQDYFIYKNQLINCLVHGQGILYGLEVTKEGISFAPEQQNKIKVKLSTGAALDCFGRVILVPDSNQEKEVEDTYQAGKLNYLYLVYDKFSGGTAAALEETNCDNSCADDYTRETYKLIISVTPPAGQILGKVQTEGKPISGARIEALDPNKTVKAVTFTNELGKYNLFVPAGTYTLQASALSFESVEIANVTITNPIEPVIDRDFSLAISSSESQPQLCQELTQAYYTDYLRFPPESNDPKIFLAVLNGEETIEVDEVATKQYRSVVYNNPMLHQLLCDHLADFNNPHRTTAAQVKALQSVNGVGNVGDIAYVSNINLVSDETITIDPDPDNQNIRISSNIRVDPGNDIKSVNTTIEPGDSSKLAREDHVHDLADKVVTSEKINDDAVERKKHLADITDLLDSSNSTILLDKNNTDKTIDLSTNVATGIIKFSGITPGLFNVSGQITPFQPPLPNKMKGVAIVMAISGLPETNSLIFMGELENRIPSFTLPLLTAIYQPEQDFFNIFLKDSRQPGDGEVGQSIDWKVHWWAIPAAKSGAEVTVPPPNENFQIIANDPLLLRIAMQPGITRRQLLAEGISTDQLTSLQTNELIKVEGTGNNRKYFIKAEN
jgi:Carboxypeptidase regulatory-like domain